MALRNMQELTRGEGAADIDNTGYNTDTNIVVKVTVSTLGTFKMSVTKGTTKPIDFHICARTESGAGVVVPTLTTHHQMVPP